MVVSSGQGDQLNGLLAVLDRYSVSQIMSLEVPADSRAGREWQDMIALKGRQPIELQSAALDAQVNLKFDGASALIESGGNCIAIGPSEQAQINVIAGQADRLPEQPQLIFTWTPIVSDTRVIDLAFEDGGVTIGEVR